jgi:hypothetical protein
MVKLRSGRRTIAEAAFHVDSSDDGPPFPFLKLPFELRDCIYRMLLTTQYAYIEEQLPNDSAWPCKGKFDIRPSILLANKQIYMEANKVLYTGNDFAVFKFFDPKSAHNPWKSYIPAFQRLSEKRVTNPKLRIVIKPVDVRTSWRSAWVTIVTTAEGIPSIIFALWSRASDYDFYQPMTLALKFHHDAQPRYQFVLEQFTSPWTHIHGFRRVTLTGDISKKMIRDIRESIAHRPRENELVDYMEQFNRKAEEYFDRGDFAAAKHQWVFMQGYWSFNFVLRISYKSSPIAPSRAQIFEIAAKLAAHAKLRVIMLHITNQEYERAWSEAANLLRCTVKNYGTDLEPMFKAKIHLCRLFSMAAYCHLERLQLAALHSAVTCLRQSSLFANGEFEELRNEVRWGIDNSLIRLGTRHRCCRTEIARPQFEGGPDWVVRPAYRSFWEWLELPE